VRCERAPSGPPGPCRGHGARPTGFLGLSPSLASFARVSSTRLLLERALPIGILAVAIVSVPVMIFSTSGLDRLNALRQERLRAETEISRLSQQIRELRAEVKRIKDDPAAVEQVARDELGLVRQTELVFQFKD
jgi:cell division protein FtsB